MFPTQEVSINTENDIKKTTTGKSFFFDFKIGEFNIKDGKLQELTGIEALKMWIVKVLKTEKYKFRIYNSRENEQYGVTLADYVSSDLPLNFIKAEIQREVTTTLLSNPNIKHIDNFNIIRDKRTLIISFSVRSIYGTLEQKVII